MRSCFVRSMRSAANLNTTALLSPSRLLIQNSRALCTKRFSSQKKASRSFTTVVEAGRGGLAELLRLRDEQNGGGRLQQGKVSARLSVPDHIGRPPYAESGEMPPFVDDPEVHDAEGIKKMRASCKLAAQVLEYAGSLAKPGVTTDSIDKAVHKMIVDNDAYPSPLNYGKFPKSVCTSINECVCHGIPDNRELQDGDLLNIDVTVYLDGYHGDTSKMFFIGDVSDEAKRIAKVTEEARDAAIALCAPGVETKQIGRVIQEIASKNGYSVVKDFVGHGVGRRFHAGPYVFHHKNNERGKMVENQTFTIEPILINGGTRTKTWNDNWTVVSSEGSLSAQLEHTILITRSGPEVLTLP